MDAEDFLQDLKRREKERKKRDETWQATQEFIRKNKG